MEYSDILNKSNSLINRSVQKAVLCIKDVDLDRYADSTNELAKAALQLAKKYNVEMPIVEQVNEVLFDDKSPADAVRELMLRDKKIEGNNNIEWKE